ncbi:uncharacterized protein C8orf74-like [Hydractinia symbiolongicarpus]|uniref:uncharacterized protein C8orf74-like n=1 Tax=Hydractinia symbiolongicarpus TaxID=13093 RepID=UPI00254DFB48|nr:uncharacterized protein C8orf74-like [Hydractinia symbiolongicarpus]
MLEDALLDCFHFLHKEGLPEYNMKIFLKFFFNLLKETVFAELSIDEAVALFRTKMNELCASGHFKSDFLKSSIDYICLTVIQHYHLFVYALCYQRDEQVHVYEALVEVPPRGIAPLSASTPADVWTRQQKIKEEDFKFLAQEQMLNATLCSTTETTVKELESYMKSLEELCSDTVTVNEISEIVNSIIKKHGDLTAAELDCALERSKRLVMLEHEKKKLTNNALGKCSQMKTASISRSKSPASNRKVR